MSIIERVQAVGEEFSDYLLVDNLRNSLIINVETQYLEILIQEYKRLQFSLIHTTAFKSKDSVTCVFTKDS
jgi:hypothetical protein